MTHQNFFEKYNTFFAIIIGALLVAGAIWLTKSTPKTVPQQPGAGQQKPSDTPIAANVYKKFIADDRIVLGDKNSKNIIVEISDPSCPFCHFASGLNPDLVKQTGRNDFMPVAFGGKYVAAGPEFEKLATDNSIAYVYSYGNGHGNGRLAAEALYCAHEHGRFWKAHNKLMSGDGYKMINDTVQNDRTKSDILAKFLGTEVDEPFMSQCLSSAKYESRIDRDIAENSQLQFAGTPHFVINGTIFRGAQEFTAMKGLIK
jgi:protein-disulfide isomerase